MVLPDGPAVGGRNDSGRGLGANSGLLLFPSVVLGKIVDLWDPQFPYLEKGAGSPQSVVGIRKGFQWEVLGSVLGARWVFSSCNNSRSSSNNNGGSAISAHPTCLTDGKGPPYRLPPAESELISGAQTLVMTSLSALLAWAQSPTGVPILLATCVSVAVHQTVSFGKHTRVNTRAAMLMPVMGSA